MKRIFNVLVVFALVFAAANSVLAASSPYGRYGDMPAGNSGEGEFVPPASVMPVSENELIVDELYNDILGRQPDREGKANALAALENGSLTPEQLKQQLMNSDEAFVYNLYGDVFGTEPDDEGRGCWTYALTSGEMSQDQLRYHFESLAAQSQGNYDRPPGPDYEQNCPRGDEPAPPNSYNAREGVRSPDA